MFTVHTKPSLLCNYHCMYGNKHHVKITTDYFQGVSGFVSWGGPAVCKWVSSYRKNQHLNLRFFLAFPENFLTTSDFRNSGNFRRSYISDTELAIHHAITLFASTCKQYSIEKTRKDKENGYYNYNRLCISSCSVQLCCVGNMWRYISLKTSFQFYIKSLHLEFFFSRI